MEKNTCSLEEHVHSESCLAKKATDTVTSLNCSYAILNVHEHSETCYDSEGNLLCGMADFLVHTHNADCLDENGALVCQLPEIKEHTHTDSCYTVAEPAETEPAHQHGPDCYTTERGDLTCTLEETEEHSHTDSCFEEKSVLVCQLEEADDALNGTYGGVVLTKGVGTFKLKAGDSVTINNIPIRQHGTHYRVTELGYDGYIVETSMSQQVTNEALQSHGPYTQDYFESSIQPDSAMAQRQTVVFENYGGPVLPHTGGMGTTVHTIAGVTLMLFSLVCLLPRRKIYS